MSEPPPSVQNENHTVGEDASQGSASQDEIERLRRANLKLVRKRQEQMERQGLGIMPIPHLSIDSLIKGAENILPDRIKNVLRGMKDNKVSGVEIDEVLASYKGFFRSTSNVAVKEIEERLQWWKRHLESRTKVQKEAKEKVLDALQKEGTNRSSLRVELERRTLASAMLRLRLERFLFLHSRRIQQG